MAAATVAASSSKNTPSRRRLEAVSSRWALIRRRRCSASASSRDLRRAWRARRPSWAGLSRPASSASSSAVRPPTNPSAPADGSGSGSAPHPGWGPPPPAPPEGSAPHRRDRRPTRPGSRPHRRDPPTIAGADGSPAPPPHPDSGSPPEGSPPDRRSPPAPDGSPAPPLPPPAPPAAGFEVVEGAERITRAGPLGLGQGDQVGQLVQRQVAVGEPVAPDRLAVERMGHPHPVIGGAPADVEDPLQMLGFVPGPRQLPETAPVMFPHDGEQPAPDLAQLGVGGPDAPVHLLVRHVLQHHASNCTEGV